MPAAPADLITAREAVEILGCSMSTLHRWADTGQLATAKKLPGVRGARLFLRSDVENFVPIDNRRTATEGAA